MDIDEIDSSGLIRESYRISGITAPECRTIFLDWAVKLPGCIASTAAIARLLKAYAENAPDHPMTAILRQGLEQGAVPRRRGGRAGRLRKRG